MNRNIPKEPDEPEMLEDDDQEVPGGDRVRETELGEPPPRLPNRNTRSLMRSIPTPFREDSPRGIFKRK